MKKFRVAINGFGRIGRISLRSILHTDKMEIIAINDLTDTHSLAHLFKYDTAHGIYQGSVAFDEENLIIDGKKIKIIAEKNPELLPWKTNDIEVVLESTGLFHSKEGAGKHIKAGAKKVVVSSPAKDDMKTIVLGVNDHILSSDDRMVSNASCTTNCLAPMVKVLDDNFGIETGLMTTVHAYTADQVLQDRPHRDLRRGRAAAMNIVPTSTGATDAVVLALPHLKGKLNGSAIRVPVIDGSLTEFTCLLKKTTTVEEINKLFRMSAESSLKGIVEYSEEPLVSSDIVGNPHSCIFDSELTTIQNNLVRVVGWYDNETGYSNRVVELMEKIANL